MNIVLEPDILFINSVDLSDEVKRDSYLTKLMDTLEGIDANSELGIYWTDELESLLWTEDILSDGELQSGVTAN